MYLDFEAWNSKSIVVLLPLGYQDSSGSGLHSASKPLVDPRVWDSVPCIGEFHVWCQSQTRESPCLKVSRVFGGLPLVSSRLFPVCVGGIFVGFPLCDVVECS